jgi:hypothetical protein
MRRAYESCREHKRSYCLDPQCKADETNSGDTTINTDGNLSFGIGSGMAIDLTDGSIGYTAGGITFDS